MTLEHGLVRLRGRLRSLLVGDGTGQQQCNAPSASMYLDQRGDVRACCQNAGFPLGNVTDSSLTEIWHGEPARRLRAAVAEGDLSLGCNFCRWQIEDGGDAVFARMFDHLTPESPEPQWPQQLELSMSNACNLQCVMCNGEWSSSIRTHREGLPPLPTVYDEDFFECLAEFLPHLRVVKFLGGEPFLGKESLRVMEMLAELGGDIEVHVTTNGTQWSPRIERILDRLDVHVVVSLDGVRRDTYESIRIGSSLDAVICNIDRFIQYTRRRGTGFSLSHCLMRSNWREFGDFLAFAEGRGSDVYVNTVTEPYAMSLYHLPPRELRSVITDLDARTDDMTARLTGMRLTAWREQRARLGQHLRLLEAHTPPDYVARHIELGFSWLGPPDRALLANEWLDAQVATGIGVLLTLGPDGSVSSSCLVGDGAADVGELLGEVTVGSPAPPFVDPGLEDDGVVVRDDRQSFEPSLTGRDGRVRRVRVARAAQRDDDGVVIGVRVFVDVTTAWHAARSRAAASGSSDTDLVGVTVGPDGRICGLDGPCAEVFGLEPTELLGRQIDDLTDLTDLPGGLRLGAVEDLGSTGRVHHHARTVLDSGSHIATIHSFTESDEVRSTVWAVRVAPDAAPSRSAETPDP